MLVKVPKVPAGQRRTAERPATLDTFAGVIPLAAARTTTVAVGEVDGEPIHGDRSADREGVLGRVQLKRPTRLTTKDLAALVPPRKRGGGERSSGPSSLATYTPSL